jgi:hypothetical protein
MDDSRYSATFAHACSIAKQKTFSLTSFAEKL